MAPPVRPANKRDAAVVSAQGMIDNAPTRGKRGTYIKLPANLGFKLTFFQAVADREYKLIFCPFKAGKFNKATREGELAINRFLFIHKDVGPDGDWHNCPQKSFGLPCPICEYFAVQKRSGDRSKAYWDTIKDFQPKAREMFLIHDTEGPPNNLMIWEEANALFGDYLRAKSARNESYKQYAHYTKGVVVSVIGKTKQIGTNSCIDFQNIDFVPREVSVPESLWVLTDKVCLDDYVIQDTYEDLDKKFYQTAGDSNHQHLDGETYAAPEEAPLEVEPPPEEVIEEVPPEEQVLDEETPTEQTLSEEEPPPEELLEEEVVEEPPPPPPAPKPAPRPTPRAAPPPAAKSAPVAARPAPRSAPTQPARQAPKAPPRRPTGK